ncbi:hypothetical protein ACMC56_02050 [Campylobacterota bacterium DY0563]
MNTLNLESEKMQNENMKPAYIEQMLMWMTLFLAFVWLFFFVLHYATAVKLNENMDSMGKFAAKYVAALITQDNATVKGELDLFNTLNQIKIKKIGQITSADVNCVVATTPPENTNSQCIFIIQGTYNKGMLVNAGTNNMVSKTVVYNQNNAAQIKCTLGISIN